MRLKEIKPGMSILCGSKEQGDAVKEQLLKQGASWNGNHSASYSHNDRICLFNSEGQYNFHCAYIPTIKFSDLIIPELTPAEVLKICNEMCHNASSCIDCEMAGNCFYEKDSDYQKVVEICEQWKAEHEKKEPELEWVWQGKIYEIKDHDKGNFYQLKDGKGFYDTGCVNEESAEEYMADVLKDYCKDHEGEFISVVTHVCRVKR